MSTDVLGMFEGLSPEQAKELRSRIVPALEHIRAEITAGNSETKQEKDKEMSIMNTNPQDENFRLTEEEIELIRQARKQASKALTNEEVIVNRHVEEAKVEIERSRMQPLLDEYKAEMKAVPQGANGITARRKIKERYRAMGVPVDTVDFS